MTTKNMICIACPKGCRLEVTEDGGNISVGGNLCAKGERYGKSEFLDPVRGVATLVRVKGGERPVVSVRTDKAVKKDDIKLVIDLSRKIIVSAPIKSGDIIATNITEGVDLIATIDCGLKHRE